MSIKNTKGLVFLLALLVSGFAAGAAYAHKVNLFAYVEDGVVYTESYFPDGRKVNHGTVEVYDSQGNRLLTGKTDADGRFSFRVPKQDDLTIVIKAAMGHRNTFVLKKDELGE